MDEELKYAERRFDMTLRVFEDGSFEVGLYENQSGDCVQIPGTIYEYGNHPEFNDAIGEEICSWVSLVVDAKEWEDY